MKRATIASLVREGRIERVEADAGAARTKLDEARRHLVSAAAIADGDLEGAYALLYDGARKAIEAHMIAHGYRVSASKLGAHEATGQYALAALGSSEHVGDFDRMRRTRNRSQYGSWAIGAETLRADLRHAGGIVEVVEDALS